jgi:hypothetical protein
MSGYYLTTSATVLCPHGGQVTLTTSNTVFKVEDTPVVLITDVGTIAGCAFTLPGPKPSPCVTLRWLTGSTIGQVNGVPAVLHNSSGLCLSAENAPQGPPSVVVYQLVADDGA